MDNKRSFRFFWLHASLIVLLFSLPLCARAETLKLGWIGPLTGNSAVLGVDSVPAAQIALSDLQPLGAKKELSFELIVEDDQHDTARSISAYRKLVSEGTAVILMSTYGGFLAASELAARDNVILINPLDCNEEIAKLPENVFCIATLTESISEALAADLQAKQLYPALIVYDETHPFMTIVERSMVTRLGSKANVQSSGIDLHSFSEFRSLFLPYIKKGVKSIVFLGHDPMGKAMSDARQLGSSAQFYTVGTITSPGFQKLAGEAANGTLVAYWEAPAGQAHNEFLSKFTGKVGRPPILELASIPTYDAVQIVGRAFLASAREGIVDRAAAQRALYQTKEYQGVSGSITIDPDGIVRSIKERIYRFENGSLKAIEK